MKKSIQKYTRIYTIATLWRPFTDALTFNVTMNIHVLGCVFGEKTEKFPKRVLRKLFTDGKIHNSPGSHDDEPLACSNNRFDAQNLPAAYRSPVKVHAEESPAYVMHAVNYLCPCCVWHCSPIGEFSTIRRVFTRYMYMEVIHYIQP